MLFFFTINFKQRKHEVLLYLTCNFVQLVFLNLVAKFSQDSLCLHCFTVSVSVYYTCTYVYCTLAKLFVSPMMS